MSIRILLIEDNPDHVEITKRLLRQAGEDYRVDVAVDSQEGLQKIFSEDYDAVLCDYRLPDLTALDILREMNAKNKDVPFIVTTALGSEKVAVDLMKEGAYDYIVKDIMYKDALNMVIKKALDRHRTKKEKEKLEAEIRKAYEELKETQDQLIQAEKLNAIGQLASGVAHEVRNPLGIILQGVNYLESKISVKEKEVAATLTLLKESVKRAENIINALLDFSRATALDLKPADINSVLEVSLSLLKARFKFENIQTVIETKKDIPPALGDKNKLEQVFINILMNALQAMPEGGRITVRTYDKKLGEAADEKERKDRDYFVIGEKAVIVEIEDTGVGISAENLRKIFDPFFTTKGPAGGAGLGLSVSRNIVSMHKGLIDIKSQPGKGTKVTVTLKVAKE